MSWRAIDEGRASERPSIWARTRWVPPRRSSSQRLAEDGLVVGRAWGSAQGYVGSGLTRSYRPRMSTTRRPSGISGWTGYEAHALEGGPALVGCAGGPRRGSRALAPPRFRIALIVVCERSCHRRAGDDIDPLIRPGKGLPLRRWVPRAPRLARPHPRAPRTPSMAPSFIGKGCARPRVLPPWPPR